MNFDIVEELKRNYLIPTFDIHRKYLTTVSRRDNMCKMIFPDPNINWLLTLKEFHNDTFYDRIIRKCGEDKIEIYPLISPCFDDTYQCTIFWEHRFLCGQLQFVSFKECVDCHYKDLSRETSNLLANFSYHSYRLIFHHSHNSFHQHCSFCNGTLTNFECSNIENSENSSYALIGTNCNYCNQW